ncbi:MAG TPA: 3-hydroxyacyl-CoA dehydrogenase NAD-binding domain-containing protein [Bryobacteraceae bacterium]|nr:3-hydroxyacyl-CoA dehydrogenase NAD-binding domain-containing protein [Bryobacteraceae bacterium]
MRTIHRVAVLGAGTMGSRIAAHFANAGVPALLLDVAGQPNRNAPALLGIQNALKQRPGGFFTDDRAALVEAGNFDDDLAKLAGCDWVIEAIVENLEAKRSLWRKVEAVRKPDAVLSTNTSGIPLASISEGFSPGFRRHFCGTHFFNPPRYLHLMELIPGPETDPAILADIEQYADRRLGKGVVRTKDTPNFIANRIGSFMGGTIGKVMVEEDFSIEEVDALTGPLIGIPNSASFRLLDLVGLDVWGYVGTNLYELVPNDPWRDRFLPLDFEKKMIEQKWLGDKTGQGFYKKSGKADAREILVLDWKTLEYHPLKKPKFPSVDAARNIEDLGERVRTLLRSDDRAGRFLWKVLSDLFLYCAEMIPEISDRIVEIDRAMRWGYGHKLGPFELWDAIGFLEVISRLEMTRRALPAHIKNALARGIIALYRPPEPRQPAAEYFDFRSNGYLSMEPRPGILTLRDRKRTHSIMFENAGASLIDLGDGVLCVEFHSKLNTLGEDAMVMLQAGLEETNRNFEAMIIANEGETFSAGANLMLVLLAAQEGEWDDLNLAVQRFQQINMALKYAAKPVVAAPFSRALGGGCEIVLHSSRAQASAETYIGLVEVAVGVIPAAGGCKELLARLKDPMRIFELIGYAKVSSSAEDARKLGLLHRADSISMNPERLIGDAKALALSLVPTYSPPAPVGIPVQGESAYAMMKLGAWSARQGNYISDYDVIIAEKLAHVLSGGRLTGPQTVSEQYLLDLEREAFLSLCGNPKTQERMQYMLKTGKPLRN